MSKLESDLYSKLKEKEETFLSFNLDFSLPLKNFPVISILNLKKVFIKRLPIGKTSFLV